MKEKEICIIGTGFSGLCVAIELKKSGNNDFVILEKANDVGGTWRDNIYPGAACDVKSHLYSFSFAPNPNWSEVFSGQKEILIYLKHCVEKYHLDTHIVYQWELATANYMEAEGKWRIKNTLGESYKTQFLIMGNGALHLPSMPDIEGISQFKGAIFHSSNWQYDINLKNKTVAVIGTGASAIQFVPEIAKEVNKLYLFQRTAPWILPKPNPKIGNIRKWLFQKMPFFQKLYRYKIYWMNELFVLGFVFEKSIMKAASLMAKWHLNRQVVNEELKKKLLPNFIFGCKRVLLSNNYYPALMQKNVEVVSEKITRINSHSIQTELRNIEAIDVIICGTGFHVTNSFYKLKITGLNNIEINDLWNNNPTAYLGTVVSGFPNFFVMTGPNTGLGHSSMVFMIESQARYIKDAIYNLKKNNVKSFNIKPEIQEKYNQYIDCKMKNTVWKSGCNSWYLTPSGRNATLWPGFTFQFRHITRKFDFRNYQVEYY